MPVLSWAQRRAGRELGSRTAVADSRRTDAAVHLPLRRPAGRLGPEQRPWLVVGRRRKRPSVIAGIAVREGINAWRGEACCS